LPGNSLAIQLTVTATAVAAELAEDAVTAFGSVIRCVRFREATVKRNADVYRSAEGGIRDTADVALKAVRICVALGGRGGGENHSHGNESGFESDAGHFGRLW
jgi:hypothetical protein